MTTDMPDGTRPRPASDTSVPSRRTRRVAWTAGWVVMAVVLVVAVGEWAGWPFLGGPLQNWLSQRLDRRLQLTDADSSNAGARFRFLGSVRVDAPMLLIGAPAWQAPSALPTVQATGVHLTLRYRDLWRIWQGGDLRVHVLSAATLNAELERRRDGRATWQFGPPAEQDRDGNNTIRVRLPSVGTLRVDKGNVHWTDQGNDADIQAQFLLTSADTVGSNGPGATAGSPRLRLTAHGRLRKLPLTLELQAHGALPLLSDDTHAATLLRINGHWGSSTLEFDGKAVDVLRASEASGRFLLTGPSLAAVGDTFGVTLPSTTEFRAVGRLVRRGQQWQVAVDDATVGTSKLKGAFRYDASAPTPVLSGHLTGARLFLSDLAPAVGATPAAQKRSSGKVLPDRHFDLPSLRAMRANVLIDVQKVDLNTDLLEPLRPLRAHLMLTDGVLRIESIDARTAQGSLQGSMQLDGRQEQAIWASDLRWRGVELADWIHQKRAGTAVPYISGKLTGSAQWTGKGQSTAQILGSLNGPMRFFLRDGQVSHLAVEIAGIDLFQGLGLLIKGDESLAIRCAAAQMVATNGVIRPTVFVVDTDDSVVAVDGSVSLVDETLDLRLVVTPKDFSLLTLRSPLRVRGQFADPKVSLDSSVVGAKVASSVLLGLINPLAALIPLIDPGDASATTDATAGCRALAKRIAKPPASSRRVQPDR